MGMAASQARFLQLTARRSNIEYQGQQINQQRLALANASAGLFEKMLTLEVPTPPSSQDDKYYKQGYTFTDSSDELQKKISWSSDSVSQSDLIESMGYDYGTGSGQITTTSVTFTRNATAAEIAGGTANVDTNGDGTNDAVSTSITAGTIALAAAGDAAAMDTVTSALGTQTTDEQKALGYKDVIRNVTITHNVYDPDGNYTTVTKESPAVLQFDNLNRLINVTLLNNDNVDVSEGASQSEKANHIGNGDALTYSGVFDNAAYEDDMNEYEFKKAAYDYQIETINAQTKEVQQQDKSLELKMKQLDTEHNAVQTEMEAVQKVIQKNIEGSFKTFA